MTKLFIITVILKNLAGLQKIMESVFAETFTDYEFIIIDRRSIDVSKNKIKKLENKFVYCSIEKVK